MGIYQKPEDIEKVCAKFLKHGRHLSSKNASVLHEEIAHAASDHTKKEITDKLQDLEEHGFFTTSQARGELEKWLEAQHG